MSRRSILVLGISAAFALAACSSTGGAGAATSGASAAASTDTSDGGYGYGSTTETAVPATSASAAAATGPCTTTDVAPTVKAAMDGRAFIPGEIDAKVGDVIAFTNGDPVSHTATLDDGSCTTKRLAKGQTGALTFSAPGTYPFHCQVHPDLTGTIKVTG